MANSSIVKSFSTALFGATIALSAFLLFQVQPLIGKFILPWFGGGPAVWTTSMFFFQVLLLGGYTYAHSLSRLRPRRQAALHLLVVLAVLGWAAYYAADHGTPITPDPGWKPIGEAEPIRQVLGALLFSVGVPYFLLSTTSSLAQSWFRDIQAQSSPYAFYALSNAASLLALISYPIWVEPNWTVRQQAEFWSVGFGLYLLLMAACALLLRRFAAPPSASQPAAGTPDNEEILPSTVESRPPSWRTSLYWASLAACASVMLLATTNEMTQDIASAPFLWVLPLSLYLLSFVVAFTDRLQPARGVFLVLTIPALLLGYFSLEEGSSMSITLRLAANAVMLLIVCLFCHSELYARRPHPRYLTAFYLMVSVGGAAGGVLVSLVAPLVFNDFWEYHLGLVFTAAVGVYVVFSSRGTWLQKLRIPYSLAALVLVGLILSTPYYWLTNAVYMSRNFYGVIRVRTFEVEQQPGYSLVHGGILHGSQVSTEPYRYRPTKYYTESTGIGLALNYHPARLAGQPLRMGMVGLGAGTVAAYGQNGDVFRFYEIDPDVVRVAQDGRYFTYLEDSQADIEVVLGDARLSLERELQENRPQNYDVLAIDAFSGDAIPIHLINQESVALYLAHLKPDGVLAFHISNRHIDLEPVLARLAQAYNLQAALIQGGGGDWQGSYASWVLLSRTRDVFDVPSIATARGYLAPKPGVRLWTDDYSNLFLVLKD